MSDTSGGRLRPLLLRGDPAACGAIHGARLAPAIREYTDERVHLACDGSWAGRKATRAELLALAECMLPAHQAYSPELYAEMLAMAEAAGISPAEAVIVGGFTDFVDAVRALGRAVPEEDDCTATIVPATPASDGVPWFAQTWDMHATATAHVVLLDLQPASGPAALLFSTAGCLGQIGMNEHGICVGINNLNAADGQIGVTWPFVVRAALAQRTIEAALDCVLRARLAGGHDFLLLDAQGRGYNVEAMPTHTAVTPLGDRPLVHTNHCLDAACQAREAPKSTDLQLSSVARLEVARQMLGGSIDRDLLFALLREPSAVCRRSAPPWHVESSGAVVARPDTRELWAVWGIPADHAFERFMVGRHD
jgi:isopenicillin-N N-acyltransferase-like protein